MNDDLRFGGHLLSPNFLAVLRKQDRFLSIRFTLVRLEGECNREF